MIDRLTSIIFIYAKLSVNHTCNLRNDTNVRLQGHNDIYCGPVSVSFAVHDFTPVLNDFAHSRGVFPTFTEF